jgi:hypothetical protein
VQKTPLTFQCPSAQSCDDLVSALVAWDKSASLGSMPYLYQGVFLGSHGEITALWADSPMAKAGVKTGEVIWSIKTDTDKPQGKGTLEKTLDSLDPGPCDLYVVTSDDWRQAADSQAANGVDMNPMRKKLIMTVP